MQQARLVVCFKKVKDVHDENRVTRRDRGVNREITLLRLEGEARGGSHGFVKMPAIDVETQRRASELCLEQGNIQLCKAAADIDHVTERFAGGDRENRQVERVGAQLRST